MSNKTEADFEAYIQKRSNEQLFSYVMKDCANQLKEVEKFCLRFENNFLNAADDNVFVDTATFRQEALVNACKIIRIMDKIFAL